MKYCPQCQKQYTEDWITFCSDDGTILIDTGYTPSQPHQPGSQRPPYAPPSVGTTDLACRRSKCAGWLGSTGSSGNQCSAAAWQPPPPPYLSRPATEPGLAVASMIVGILGLFVGMFCLGPIPGIVALILGFVALSQIKRAPHLNGGKPFAIVGMVTGSLSLRCFTGALIIWQSLAIFVR